MRETLFDCRQDIARLGLRHTREHAIIGFIITARHEWTLDITYHAVSEGAAIIARRRFADA